MKKDKLGPLEAVREQLLGYIRVDRGGLLLGSPEALYGQRGTFPNVQSLEKMVQAITRDRKAIQIPFEDQETGAGVLVSAANSTHPVVARMTPSGQLVEVRIVLDPRYDWLPMPDDETPARIEAALSILRELPPILRMDADWKIRMLQKAGFTEPEIIAIQAKDQSGDQ